MAVAEYRIGNAARTWPERPGRRVSTLAVSPLIGFVLLFLGVDANAGIIIDSVTRTHDVIYTASTWPDPLPPDYHETYNGTGTWNDRYEDQGGAGPWVEQNTFVGQTEISGWGRSQAFPLPCCATSADATTMIDVLFHVDTAEDWHLTGSYPDLAIHDQDGWVNFYADDVQQSVFPPSPPHIADVIINLVPGVDYRLFAGAYAQTNYDSGNFSVSFTQLPIPEPGTGTCLGLGIAVLAARRADAR